jgi:hypothetical protein
MHGIDVGFGKDRGGHGDDRWDEGSTSLAQLAYITSFSIPVNIADNLNTTQTPECTKEKYNAKIKVKGSLLRSHQQPT